MHRAATIGDFLKASVRHVAFYPKYRRGRRYKPIRLGHIVRGLVVQTRHPVRFSDNARLFFLQNAVVLLKRRGLLRSKQIVGPLPRTIRRRQYSSIFSGIL